MAGEKDNISGAILWISLRVLVNMLFILLLIEGFVTAYHFSYKLFADIPYVVASQETMNITITEGSRPKEIASILEFNGIVDDKYLFLVRVYLGKYQDKILAGTYTLGPGMSPDDICREICGMKSEDET